MNGHVSCDTQEIRRADYLGEIPSSVAGWYYRQATALPGEHVSLVRELGNPYDPNAIAVHNAQGQKIGFVPRKQAAILAPALDSLTIRLSGRLLEPGEAGFDEELAQTRPPLILWGFMNVAVGSTISAETAATS